MLLFYIYYCGFRSQISKSSLQFLLRRAAELFWKHKLHTSSMLDIHSFHICSSRLSSILEQALWAAGVFSERMWSKHVWQQKAEHWLLDPNTEHGAQGLRCTIFWLQECSLTKAFPIFSLIFKKVLWFCSLVTQRVVLAAVWVKGFPSRLCHSVQLYKREESVLAFK